ncbi:aminotransferase, class i/classii [Grosmannia clavigera kw1407]|uniref:Aminotransferase, class i/classii n=1 Tax=Grosmannia clavigera (strain kw1407 / UAMH 11150) TaxID=655863 RepID=F0XSQ9_GROCL|nr:aminotransferase, class i/classii [Grosmannia clavigera kw1407]EFW99246.1 aminotransferase, class i/classii [Grosmannia clavigera kw1407]
MTEAATAEKPLINFLRGWPHASLLAADRLRMAASHVLAAPELMADSLLYGPDPGYEPLREQLAVYLSAAFGAHGAPADPKRICITGGASQNVANVLLSFTDPVFTAVVWVCAPCYHLACPIFDDAGFAGRLRAVAEDDEGIDVVRLEEGMAQLEEGTTRASAAAKQHLPPDRKAYRHVIYVVPTSANPSGRTMTLARRQALVRLARRHDALILADDVYDLLQWPVADESSSASVALPPTLPRLVDVDRMLPLDHDHSHDQSSIRFGNVVSNGSFSKLVGPGVRTGWAEATPDFVYGLSQTGNTRSGGAPSQLTASIVCEMMRSGGLDAHLSHVVRPALQRRHRTLVTAVETHLCDHVQIENRQANTYGGYFLWLRLRRQDIAAAELAARAMAAENLVVPPGSMFRVKGDEAAAPFDHHLRLCFAWEDEDRLDEGVRRLARVFRDWDAQPATTTTNDLSESFTDTFK